MSEQPDHERLDELAAELLDMAPSAERATIEVEVPANFAEYLSEQADMMAAALRDGSTVETVAADYLAAGIAAGIAFDSITRKLQQPADALATVLTLFARLDTGPVGDVLAASAANAMRDGSAVETVATLLAYLAATGETGS